ncbi:DUF2279 domain-containing protein [Pontimicrobium aquaticum]|uniref:DUF2279 domain-containing protein n=1 Tax=Pontimicrobium aquaticum TaxID=2565367 RepID=A0A4U0EVX5_9FLAO|nr:DUF2279 domain-containing protein [Pontimicrobium aquaticum]TJY36106.1 DUF2279 domain-containing protein [Pontimicrobium aquaticum]
MSNKITFTFLFVFISLSALGQQLNTFLKPSDTLNVKRRNAVVISETIIGTSALISLNSLWYQGYKQSKFHTINDLNEWMQMDKVGHAFSAYQLARVGADVLNWSGVSKKDQLIYGATLGFTFLSAVEIFDGFSKEWGFSWSDIAANSLGTGLYIGQELLWQEQRMQLKYSFSKSPYANRRPDKLGDSFIEQMFKDYNGQTYWLSMNLNAFFKEANFPKWLNLAIGYGANGMLTGENEVVNNMFTNQDRYRQFYLSFDVNLNNINTKSNVLKTIFSVLNVIKIPLPTVEFNSKKKVVFHLLLQ